MVVIWGHHLSELVTFLAQLHTRDIDVEVPDILKYFKVVLVYGEPA